METERSDESWEEERLKEDRDAEEMEKMGRRGRRTSQVMKMATPVATIAAAMMMRKRRRRVVLEC